MKIAVGDEQYDPYGGRHKPRNPVKGKGIPKEDSREYDNENR